MEKYYVHTMLSNRVPVTVGVTGNNFSSMVRCEHTNPISDTSHPNGPSSTKFQSWAAPLTTNNSNEHNIGRKYELMEGLQKQRLLVK